MLTLVAAALIGGSPGPVPAPEPVPPRVTAFARTTLLPQARDVRAPDEPVLDTAPGSIRRSYTWSDDVLAGRPTTHPIVPTDSWIVVATSKGRPVAYGAVTEYHGGLVSGGMGGRPQTAAALAAVRDGLVVTGPGTSGFEVVSADGSVAPLPSEPFPAMTTRVSLPRAQQLVAAHEAEFRRNPAVPADRPTPRAGVTTVGTLAVLALLGLGGMLVAGRRLRGGRTRPVH